MNDKTAKMLERVRALLAKADSTQFPEEADAFRAKADELMTTYAIDQWMVEQAEAGRNVRQEPVRRDFDRSWRGSPFRSDLFNMFFDVAEHCRCVVGTRGQTAREMPVFGLPSDLDYLDLLFTGLMVEVAKNLQPSVDPNGELGHEVFKQRQAGIAWPDITRKVFQAGLVTLTAGEFEKLKRSDFSGDLDGMDPEDVSWEDIARCEYWRQYRDTDARGSLKNRLANANRRYVRDNGLQGQRNYVKPEVYQRSFMMGFVSEIARRLRAMREASRSAYDASHEAGSMALAVRDIRSQALSLYEEAYPPPPPLTEEELEALRNLPKGRAIKPREVVVDYGAMGAGRRAAEEVDLAAHPSRRVEGQRGIEEGS